MTSHVLYYAISYGGVISHFFTERSIIPKIFKLGKEGGVFIIFKLVGESMAQGLAIDRMSSKMKEKCDTRRVVVP